MVKTVLVSGNFNILHPGHLRLLRFARECGEQLIVAVHSDRMAGEAAMVPEKLRLEGLQSNSWVSRAFIVDEPIQEVIRRLKPDVVVKGKEHEGLLNPEEGALSEYGGRLIFSSGDSIFSTVELLRAEIASATTSTHARPVEFLRRHQITSEESIDVLQRFRGLRVCVVGDLIVDEYITCDPLGMSQEDPTIVVTPVATNMFLGGAGIVAAHAAGLGARVSFVSVSGDDACREFTLGKLMEYKVQADLVVDENRPTTLKQRFRAKGKTLLRVSRLSQVPISTAHQSLFETAVERLLDDLDLLVFSDFNYGCLPQPLVERIIASARRRGVMLVADSQSSSQDGDISRFRGMRLITPTEREARSSLRNQSDGLVVIAQRLRDICDAENILLKLGEEGVLVHTRPHSTDGWHTDQIQALNPVPTDVAGAGDSMLITAALALAAEANIWQASYLGSLAAAIQVGRVGNLPLASDELFQELRS